MYTSQIKIGSQTASIKASKILKAYGLQCDIIKADKDSSKGCIFALKINTEDYKTAVDILSKNGIKI